VNQKAMSAETMFRRAKERMQVQASALTMT